MAESKDKRTRHLRADRRKVIRQAKRTLKRRSEYLRDAQAARKRGDNALARKRLNQAQEALRIRHEQLAEAQRILNDIRARRRSLRHRLHLPSKKGTGYLDGKQVAAWIIPILIAARKSGYWKGRVSSGFRSYAQQWYIYFVARIRPAAYPGRSNHEGSEYPKGAVDVTDPWGLNRYLDSLPANHPHRRLKWYRDTLGAGDDWHFSGTGR